MDAPLKIRISSYLQLPIDNIPDDPIVFLRSYLNILPSSFLQTNFSWVSPKQRSVLPEIRNRRFAYTKTNPNELSAPEAKLTWPALWRGHGRPGIQQGESEHTWAKSHFMEGSTSLHIGKLANLLRDYEEERQAERIRAIRSEVAATDEFVPDEDTDSEDSDDDQPPAPLNTGDEESESDFERRIQERFIYGLLDHADYNAVDWNDSLDDHNEKEEAWMMDDSD